MDKSQWTLLITLCASFYNAGTIWMVQIGYQIWPIVGPAEFPAYHGAWWLRIIPVVFPIAAVAFAGSWAMVWWRPPGVSGTMVWLSVALQTAVYLLTAAFWAPWQAHLGFARLADGSLDPLYVKIMSTHWIRVALLTANAVVLFWMAAQNRAVR